MKDMVVLWDLASILAKQANISPKEAYWFAREFFALAEAALVKDKTVEIDGLGSFNLKKESEEGGEKSNYVFEFIPDIKLSVEAEEEAPEKLKPVEIKAEEIAPRPQTSHRHRRGGHSKSRKHRRKRKKRLNSIIFFSVIAISLAVAVFVLFTPDREEKTLDINKVNLAAIEEIPKDSVEIVEVQQQKDSLPENSATTVSQPETAPQPTKIQEDTVYTIQKGDNLMSIAANAYGARVFWVYIMEENKGKLKSPNAIVSGMKLKIPPSSKYGINASDSSSIASAKQLESRFYKNN